MRVLVTGATGFVGLEILSQLHQQGHSIRILARNPQSPRVRQLVSSFSAEVHPGDVLNAATLAGAANNTVAVVHLVGIISEVGQCTFENVHTRGTQNMVAAAQQAGVGRYIHMSALGTRPNAASRYHQTKWAAEELVRHSALEFTIFRPSLIYGPGDQFINLFAKIIRRSPIVPLLASRRARFQPVPVEAVATAFAKSLLEPKSVGQTYALCGPEALTLSDIVDRIQDVLGKRRLKLRLPLGLARCQAACLEFFFQRLLHAPPPLNRDQLLMLQEDNIGDPQPANDLFDLRPVPLRKGIEKYLLPRNAPDGA